MQLVIFDIDGTLLKTFEIDATCYAQTFNELFESHMPMTDRSQFYSSTDSGLLKEASALYLGRDLNTHEIKAFQARFFAKLEHELKSKNDLMIFNAGKTFLELQQHPNTDVAIATGAWLTTAKIKLDAIGLNYKGVPLASSNDSDHRIEIIRHAINLSISHYGNQYKTITYVGDKHWDYLAAKQLNIEFYGIGDDSKMKELNKYGNGSIDYGKQNTFIA